MPYAKGYKSFLGVGRESTLGTVVARTIFSRFNSEGIEETNNVINSARLAPSQQVVEQGLRFSGGSVGFDGNYEGMEVFFKDAFGQDTITTPGGATTARLHTFALTDDLPSPGCSIEISKGGLQSHLYSDMKIRSMRLSGDSGSLLQVGLEYIGRIETLVSASVPSYAALLPIPPAHLVLTIDGSPVGVTSWEVGINNQLSGSDRPDAAGRDIKEPERMQVRVVEGVINLDYDATTQYNKFKNGTDAALLWTWTGALIEGGQNYLLTLSCPRVRFSGTTPKAGGPGVLPLSLPFRAYETAVGASNEIGATIKNRITSVI